MTPYTHSSRAMAPPSYKHNSNQHGYHSNRTTLTSLSEVPVLLLPDDDNNKSNNRNSGRYSSSYSSSKGAGSRTVRISSSAWTGSSSRRSSRSSQSRSSTSKRPPGKAGRGQPRTKNIGRGRILIVSPEPRAAAAAAEQPAGGPTGGTQGQKGPGWTCCRCGCLTSLRWLDCDNRQCRHYRCGSPHAHKTSLNSSGGGGGGGQIVRVFLTRGNKTKTKTNGIAAAAAGGRGRTCHGSSRSSLPKEYYSDGCVINKGPGVLKRMGLRLVRKLARHVPPLAGRRASRCGCGVGPVVFRGCC